MVWDILQNTDLIRFTCHGCFLDSIKLCPGYQDAAHPYLKLNTIVTKPCSPNTMRSKCLFNPLPACLIAVIFTYQLMPLEYIYTFFFTPLYTILYPSTHFLMDRKVMKRNAMLLKSVQRGISYTR